MSETRSKGKPELQRLPPRTEFGRQLQEAFVAAEPHTFMEVDYAGLELRFMVEMEDPLNDDSV